MGTSRETGIRAASSKRIGMQPRGPRSFGDGPAAQAALHGGRDYITNRAQGPSKETGRRSRATEKSNKTETNFGKGACQATGSGLRILQAGRFVIEAAFLIPGAVLCLSLMPMFKNSNPRRLRHVTVEMRPWRRLRRRDASQFLGFALRFFVFGARMLVSQNRSAILREEP